MKHSWSHDPCEPNATLGSLDYSVVDQPIYYYQFNSSPNGAVTIGAYSVLDLGAAANGGSDLRLDVIAFTDVRFVCFFIARY